MAGKGIELCIFWLFCTGTSTVWSLSLQASFTPNPAIRGASSRLTVRCNFTAGASVQIRSVQMSADQETIATLLAFDAKPLWNTAGATSGSLKARGDLFGTVDSKYLSLTLNDTRCSDQGVFYGCEMTHIAEDGSAPVTKANTTVEIQAAPLTPDAMTVTPPPTSPSEMDHVTLTEFTEMTFTCSGNVGRPAGSFSWFTVTGQSGQRQPVTPQSVQQGSAIASSVPGEECTFNQTSSLTLNLTGNEDGRPLYVLCIVGHQAISQEPSARDCSDPAVDFCQRSVPINVQYPVRVTVGDSLVVAEGTDVSVDCVPRGNPVPHLIEWRREEHNETLASGPNSNLTLRSVTLDDSGRYVCTAYNVIAGVTMQASASVLVTVEKTTTPLPTTTPQSTATPANTTEDAVSDKAGLEEGSNVVIIVVALVAIVVVVSVIVVVFIVRRRRAQKQFEESPMKSLSNQVEGKNMEMDSETASSNQSSASSQKNEESLAYADLQFDNQPRSRRPLAIDDSHTEYADISMPQV